MARDALEVKIAPRTCTRYGTTRTSHGTPARRARDTARRGTHYAGQLGSPRSLGRRRQSRDVAFLTAYRDFDFHAPQRPDCGGSQRLAASLHNLR